MNRILSFATIFVLLLSLSGCKKGIADVRCKDIERVETNAGQIAVSRYGLGEIKWSLIPENGDCFIQDLGSNLPPLTVKANTSEISSGDEMSISITSSLEVSVSGDIDDVEKIEADVENQLKNKSELAAYNFRQLRLNNPIDLINKDTLVTSSIRGVYERTAVNDRNQLRFFTINRLMTGDSLRFLIDKSNASSAKLTLQSYDVEVTVNYDCSSQLGIKGDSSTYLMYQYVFMEWNPEEQKVVVSPNIMNINDCRLMLNN